MTADTELQRQLIEALRANERLWEWLRRVQMLDLPGCYLGAD